ncbi:DUF4082 domain-containing protein, partial [Planotetraspora silvatica]
MAVTGLLTVAVSAVLVVSGGKSIEPGTANPVPLSQIQQVSFWSKTTKVRDRSHSDKAPVELGMRFTPDRNGWVAGVRFYKSGEGGDYTGNLWDAQGRLLSTATFPDQSGSGWQEVSFSKPVFVWGGQDYTVSYHSENGTYVRTAGFTPVSAGPLTTTSRGGVLGYGKRAFPTRANARRYNYWVDVIFRWDPQQPSTPPSGTPSPSPTPTPTPKPTRSPTKSPTPKPRANSSTSSSTSKSYGVQPGVELKRSGSITARSGQVIEGL